MCQGRTNCLRKRPKTDTTPPIRETDLYPLLKTWLEVNGYQVHAEVGGCDVAARKGDELVLIEMKRAINIDLLLQAVGRQKATESVYVAVPAPHLRDKRWRGLLRLLKRLELGLLLVHARSAMPRVELVFHPLRQERRREARLGRAFLTEMAGRSQSLNVGGSVKIPLMTAYREQALGVAAALDSYGPTSPAALCRAGAPQRAANILYANHYGWFERTARGIYALTDKGRAALNDFPELVASIRNSLIAREKPYREGNHYR